MNPLRLLGTLALIVGAGLLASEPLLGKESLVELTGTPVAFLRFSSLLISLLGVLAIGWSVRERTAAWQECKRPHHDDYRHVEHREP
jgi:hypothetical protein